VRLMALVKICGLTRQGDIAAVNESRPDFAGFVFAGNRRRVTVQQAKAMIQSLDAAILPVGVFLDENLETVASVAAECRLRAVQLHGREDNRYIGRLKALLPPGSTVIKALRVRDAGSLSGAEQIECDLLLLDAYDESQAGGTGKAFDWRLLQGFTTPYLLAGGLHAGNVREAIRMANPYGVDVSSGVETNGVKDAGMIAEFISLTRGQRT
jgi:phosphoribosylanthranilate isomerase